MILNLFRIQQLSKRVVFVLALIEVLQRSCGFAVPKNCMRRCQRSVSHPLRMSADSYLPFTASSRRTFLCTAFSAALATPLLLPELVSAKEPVGDTIWMTGKMPQVPGQKPRDKNDLTGTRKDPNFLRSLADCKNQCENTASTGGYSKTKDECLSECQDICCTSYQQCTFAIVQRI
jgi:hypothetical protein